MRSVLEFDSYNHVLSNLGFDSGNMYREADVLVNLELAEQLKRNNLSFYRQLKEKKEAIIVRFTGFRERSSGGHNGRSDELFVIFDTVELVYPVERLVFDQVPDAKELLEKEYKVFVRKVIEGKNRVILGDNQEDTRKKAIELINTKLEAGEELYLRGNIIDLQRDTPMGGNFMAALVNIEGLGILGIIPIKKWSVGYSPLETFRGIVRNNTNAIVNFKVLQEGWIKYGNGTRRVFICSREAYLTKIGYNPWKIVCKTLSVRSVVKVRIVEEGKTAGAFFGALDGISDFNMLCYIDDNGKLSLKDIQIGKYYYGYVQKMDSKKKYMRVRLTEPAEQGSDLKISSTLAVAQK